MNMTVTVLRVSAPLSGEAVESALPQVEQNRASAVFSLPHRAQVITG
jgi:hypothetical protein